VIQFVSDDQQRPTTNSYCQRIRETFLSLMHTVTAKQVFISIRPSLFYRAS